jgi:hypothetical protein
MERMTAASPTWQEGAAQGSLEDLHAVAYETFHVDFADREAGLRLAADTVTHGAWRNNSLMEDFHVGWGEGKRRRRGFRDAEMMVAYLETARIVEGYLAEKLAHQHWWADLADEIAEVDRVLAGSPMAEQAPMTARRHHHKQVDGNLFLFNEVLDLVGDERFIAGLALAGLTTRPQSAGSPMWTDQVRAWADTEDADNPSEDFVGALIANPASVPIDRLTMAINTGLGYAQGPQNWHAHRCGNPEHRYSAEAVPEGMREFIGITTSLFGLPVPWHYAAMQRRIGS